MAARFLTRRYSIQHSRFTKQDGWRLYDLSLSLNGNIAVTGYNKNTHRTYIDVYTNVRHSDSRDKPKIIYSKEFEKYSDKKWIYKYRCVSFIDDDVLVSCHGDKLEVFQVNKDEVLRSRRVNGIANCLSVRERREIFIGFRESNKITVYDVMDLNEIKSIILQGIQDGYWAYEMTAIADRIFVCVGDGKGGHNYKSLIFQEKNGRILSELTKPTDTVQWYAQGLALNITLNVIAVAWSQTFIGRRKGKDVFVFYSLLSENNCSFLIVEVEFGVDRIRISDRGDRIVWLESVTQECKVFDMSEFFNYGHLKENLQSQLQEDDCLKLTEYFTLPDNQRDAIVKSDTPTENLLHALEGKFVIQPYDVDRLAEAFSELGIKSTCSFLVDFYRKTRTSLFYRETIQKLQEEIKMNHEENERTKKRLEMANIEVEENKTQVQNLQQELQRIKQEHKLEQDLLQTKDLLQKATQEKNISRAELEQSQLQHSITSMSLEGSTGGSRSAETAQARPPEVRRRSDGSVSSATSRYLSESAIAREFSVLLVKVSVKLTSGHCVLLATYFDLPRSKIDLIRKDSETPGITLLDVMKERSIINMYDVSNLQQALVDIELHNINQTLVKPYQEKIDPLMYERHKVGQQDKK